MPLKKVLEMVLAVALAAAACAAAGPAEFRFQRDIDCGKIERQGLVAVALDDDVYAATRDGFPDLGVFDALGRRTPCLVERATGACTRVVREPCLCDVIRRPEQKGRVRLLAVLAAGASDADGLSVFTPEKNYECLVRVLGSNDAKHWMPLAEEGLVFDYSRYLDLGNRDVRLPRNDCRQFAIDVVDIPEEDESLFSELTRRYSGGGEGERPALPRRPFHLDHVRTVARANRDPRDCGLSADYPVTLSRVQQDLAARLTMVLHPRPARTADGVDAGDRGPQVHPRGAA